MINKHKIGITSAGIVSHIENATDLNFETSSLINEAKKVFDETLLLHPWRIRYSYLRDSTMPKIFFNNKDITDLSCLLVRGTGGIEKSISVLANSFEMTGCKLIDPVERFSGGTASKLLSTIDRFKNRVGTDSYYAFSKDQAISLVNELLNKNILPLLIKPIYGKQGSGIRKITKKIEALDYLNSFFEKNNSQDIPLLVQPFKEFISEYRILLIDNQVIGMARKIKKAESVTANFATGAIFNLEQDSEILEFVIQNLNSSGILGVDVARDTEGFIHIIEANRAPQWKEFQRVTNINVAKKIVDHARKKIN